MTNTEIEAAIALNDLFVAQKRDDLNKVKELIEKLNSYPFINLTDVNFNSVLNPHMSQINASYFYIIEHLNGIVDRENLKFEAEIYQLTQRGDESTIDNYVENLLNNSENFSKITLTLFTKLIGVCIQYNRWESLAKLRLAMQKIK